MRHRLIHGYGSVDWRRVSQTLTNDLPPLLEQLRELVRDKPEPERPSEQSQ
ncbi:DUF86 domain-containing protein [candidate division WOR-3 bacterium]|nr:DUF86 domain-containing protein [candidate division WOR-3 bacterium]